MDFILAIDQGTTSSRAIIYDSHFNVVASGQHEFKQHYPRPSEVEHDLEEIWSTVTRSIKDAIEKAQVQNPDFEPKKIRAIGITNQRETYGLWQKSTGKAIAKAIVWQDRRSARYCEQLQKKAEARKMARDAGLLLDPYFSGTKLSLQLKNDKKAKELAKKKDLAFGTIDTFLIWKLTGGESHVTDTTNASRTLLMGLKNCQWSKAALKILKVPQHILPEIKNSDALFGKTKAMGVLPDGIPIHGVLGDQQAALFGQACFQKGEAKITYGTGAFALINTAHEIKKTKGVLSTVAWSVKGKTTYALEASVFIAGAAVQWLRDGLKIIKNSKEVEALANSVESSEGVFFIPAFAGLGAPYWNPDARALIGGLTRGSTNAHIAKACLEGIAHSVADVFDVFSKEGGVKLKNVRVDGGASLNDYMMQFESSLLQISLQRPKDVESTARGAAYVAALGSGLVNSLEELNKKLSIDSKWSPKMKKIEAQKAKDLWARRNKALVSGAY